MTTKVKLIRTLKEIDDAFFINQTSRVLHRSAIAVPRPTKTPELENPFTVFSQFKGVYTNKEMQKFLVGSVYATPDGRVGIYHTNIPGKFEFDEKELKLSDLRKGTQLRQYLCMHLSQNGFEVEGQGDYNGNGKNSELLPPHWEANAGKLRGFALSR